jgi:hypothetical protein
LPFFADFHISRSLLFLISAHSPPFHPVRRPALRACGLREFLSMAFCLWRFCVMLRFASLAAFPRCFVGAFCPSSDFVTVLLTGGLPLNFRPWVLKIFKTEFESLRTPMTNFTHLIPKFDNSKKAFVKHRYDKTHNVSQ